MSKKILLTMVGAVLLTAVVAVSFVSAQGPGWGTPQPPAGPGFGPPGMGPGMPMAPPTRPSMKAGPEGVFLLLGTRLLKYDAATLEEKGAVQLVERPAQGEQPGPTPIGDMTLASGRVLVVIGNTFLNVDAATLEVKARGTLPEAQLPQAAGQGPGPRGQVNAPGRQGGPGGGHWGPGGGPWGPGGGPMGPPPPPPVLELSGSTLYVMRSPQIVAVNINTGKVTAQSVLPPPMQAQ